MSCKRAAALKSQPLFTETLWSSIVVVETVTFFCKWSSCFKVLLDAPKPIGLSIRSFNSSWKAIAPDCIDTLQSRKVCNISTAEWNYGTELNGRLSQCPSLQEDSKELPAAFCHRAQQYIIYWSHTDVSISIQTHNWRYCNFLYILAHFLFKHLKVREPHDGASISC